MLDGTGLCRSALETVRKRSRKTAKKKRTNPDDKEPATTIAPVAIHKIVESPVSAALEPEPVTLALDHSREKPAVFSARPEGAASWRTEPF